MTDRKRIADAILAHFGCGPLEDTAGRFCSKCPGAHLHSTGNGARDFQVHLDGAPTGSCFHQSCANVVADFNHRLRVEIGKAEGTRSEHREGRALTWDDMIGPAQDNLVDTHFVVEEDIPRPMRPHADDLRHYIATLFKPDEFIAYTTDATSDDGKWKPAGRGHFSRTAQDVLDALNRLPLPEAMNAELNTEAGAWIRLNPFDGDGVSDRNVMEFRHALVESDGLEIPKQLALLRSLKVPAVFVVHSGGKSLHAVVRIDAGKDLELFKKRVNDLYTVLGKHGFQVDAQNRNPSRLSRMPGVDRAGKRQYIVAENIGAESWEKWEEWRNAVNDNLPEFEDMAALIANPPELAGELITGVLRQGHKLLLSGPSKAGKSFALIQLCCAISEGSRWFGMECAPGNVLYVNMELDRASCVKRFADVSRQMGLSPRHVDVWNMRGHGCGLGELVPKLVRRMEGKKYVAVVIDPIYKLLTGDENSNSDMAIFCNYLDRIALLTGTAVVVASHFSKGMQGGKAAIDRTAGAGVFGRDPDAILTLSELEEAPDGTHPYRLEFVLREFASRKPVEVVFAYPVHRPTMGAAEAKIPGAAGRPKKGDDSALLVVLSGLNLQGFENPTLQQVHEAYCTLTGEAKVSKQTVMRMAEKLVPEDTGWRYVDGVFWGV